MLGQAGASHGSVSARVGHIAHHPQQLEQAAVEAADLILSSGIFPGNGRQQPVRHGDQTGKRVPQLLGCQGKGLQLRGIRRFLHDKNVAVLRGEDESAEGNAVDFQGQEQPSLGKLPVFLGAGVDQGENIGSLTDLHSRGRVADLTDHPVPDAERGSAGKPQYFRNVFILIHEKPSFPG